MEHGCLDFKYLLRTNGLLSLILPSNIGVLYWILGDFGYRIGPLWDLSNQASKAPLGVITEPLDDVSLLLCREAFTKHCNFARHSDYTTPLDGMRELRTPAGDPLERGKSLITGY